MDYALINLNGYFIYVLSAFFLTFFLCFSLYLDTRKKLKKYEKLLLRDAAFTNSFVFESSTRKIVPITKKSVV